MAARGVCSLGLRLSSIALKSEACLSEKSVRWTRCIRHMWCAISTTRFSSLAAPEPDGSPKEYPEKIKNVVDEISKLTLIEVAELNDLLKKTLKIEDVPMMTGAMPVAPAAKAEEDAAAVKEEPTEFTVKLTAFDSAAKVKLIKQVKTVLPDMNLVQAKKFVEGLPQVIKEKVKKEEAEEIKRSLEAAGGTVEIET